MNILFVCMANVCRSPLAEYLARHLAREQDLPWIFSSAGLLDPRKCHFQRIHPLSSQVLMEMSIPSLGHTSRQLIPEMMRDVDLVLTMDRKVQNKVLRFGLDHQKVFTLLERAGEKEQHDVPDPLGGTIEDFRATKDIIIEALQRIVK